MVLAREGGGKHPRPRLRRRRRTLDEVVDLADRLRRVEPGGQPGAVGHLDAQEQGRLRLIDLRGWRLRTRRRGRGVRRGGGGRGSGRDVAVAGNRGAEPAALAAERAVDFWEGPVVLGVLLQLDVDGLVVVDVHQVQRRPTLADHLQVRGVLWVVEAVQLAVVDAEAVGPEVQDALLGRGLVAARRCGDRLSGRVGDGAALDAVAADGLACSAEEARGGRGAWLRWVVGL